MAFDAARLTTPQIHYLGLAPSDWIRLGVDLQDLLPLTDRDRKKCFSLLQNPHVQQLPKIRFALMNAYSMIQSRNLQITHDEPQK